MRGTTSLLSRLTARFRRDAKGVVALEFAFLAMPFLFIILALLELALVFLVSAALDTAMERAARTIRTGGLQTDAAFAGLSGQALEDAQETAFETHVCREMGWLVTGCRAALFVDVRTFADWASTNTCDPIRPATQTSGPTFDEDAILFRAGGPRDIVLVRGYYRWPLITPFVSQALVDLEGGVKLITSTQTFRNEPYAPQGAPVVSPTPTCPA